MFSINFVSDGLEKLRPFHFQAVLGALCTYEFQFADTNCNMKCCKCDGCRTPYPDNHEVTFAQAHQAFDSIINTNNLCVTVFACAIFVR